MGKVNAVLELRLCGWLVHPMKFFGSHAVAQRLGFIMEYIAEKKENTSRARNAQGQKYLTGLKIFPLDIKSSRKGEIAKKWKIIINLGYLEI